MATATKKVTAAESAGRGAPRVSDPLSLEFLVHQDNGGEYRWEIVGESGNSYAHSGSFASKHEAESAARCVYERAGSARFEARVAEARQPTKI